jgi:prepilin signal peptidase PulO-like enzyme (type II secretory pathway)
VRGDAKPADLSELTDNLLELAIWSGASIVVAIALTVVMERLRLHWSTPLLALPLAVGLAAVSPAVGVAVGGALTLAAVAGIVRHLQSLERGGSEARKARERVGLPALARAELAARRARSERRQGERLVLGMTRNRRLATVPLGSRQGVRGFIPGAPGSGKTVSLAAHASAYVRSGMAAIVVDPKGDRYLRSVLAAEAERVGRSFVEWTPDGPAVYNPVGRGTPTEIADKALAAEQFTEPHFLRQAQRYLGLALQTMRGAGVWPPSLAAIVEHFDPSRLEYAARLCEDDLQARVQGYVGQLTNRARGELTGVRDRLAVLAESELGPWLTADDEGLDFAEVLARREVAYVQLDADRFPLASQMLGAAIVVDLINVTAGLHGSDPSGLVVIDEFAALAAEQVSRLLSRSRSAGLSVLLATQTFADLTIARPGDQTDSLRRQVLADVDYVVAHRQSEPEAAEILAAMAGTQPAWTVTRHTRAQLGASTPADEGTRKRTREFVRHPDEFKGLRVGEAIVIEPMARRGPEAVSVWRPPSVEA